MSMKALYLWLIIGTTASSVVYAEPVANPSGPLRLTQSQMDKVTAGGILVEVSAEAIALGDLAETLTDTETRVVSGKSVERGKGSALAFACCGPLTDTSVSFEAFADGDIVVIGVRTRDIDRGWFSISAGRIHVYSRDLPSRNRPRR